MTENGNEKRYVLRLFIAGQTHNSLHAYSQLKKICEEHLQGTYEIEIVDLLHYPHMASSHDIVAIPTLIRVLPPPLKKIIGDLSDSEKVLKKLEIIPKDE